MTRRRQAGRSRKRREARPRREVRRRVPLLLGLLAAGTAGLAAWQIWPRPVRREVGLNVLLVTLDTLRADALGVYGQPRPTSPLIDRLAGSGVRFDAAHAHNTVTLASHANILSGRLPWDHGVRDNSGFRFPATLDTLATLLRGHGYHTAAFVSSATLDARFGLDRGFDVYDDAFGQGNVRLLELPERRGTATVALARNWIARQTDAPWLCWVHVYDPHAPYVPPAPWNQTFRDAPYLGEVAATDAALAPLLQPILAAGPRGKTLVVLTADHGESLGEHGERNHGLFAYEATLHVPLVLYAPRVLRPRVVEAAVRHVDVLPTILDTLALPVPDGLDGRSLLPLANGRRMEEAPTYFEALSSTLTRHWAPLRGVLSSGSKYVDLPLPELYDLRADPGESHNLIERSPGKVAALRALLARLRGDDTPIAPRPEDAELRERLAALGYLAAKPTPGRAAYGPQDDPKRLVHLDAMMQEAVDRRRTGDLRGARELARRVVEERPDMTGALLQLALIERDLGALGDAIHTLEQAVASNPEDPNPATLLASVLGEAGESERALALLAPWLQAPSPPVDALTTRGVLLARLDRPSEALASFERARALEPGNAMTLVQIATLHLGDGDRSAARSALDEALRLDPNLALAHRQLGLLALAAGDTAEAERRFRAALERDPDEADALVNLGRLLAAQEHTQEARVVLARFLAVAPPEIYGSEIGRIRDWLRAHEGARP